MIPKLPASHLLLAGFGTLLLAAPAYGQAPTFQPGYVVPARADTLRGQVRLTQDRSSRECVFRTGPDASATTYAPAQLRGYGLTGGAQFRRGRVTRGATDTTSVLRFEEMLVLGQATLLYTADENANSRFFLQMAGATVPTELRQLERRVEQPGGRVFTQTINQYQQVLLTSLADCPALAGDIRRVRLAESDLVGIVRRFNACVAPAGTATTVAPLIKASISTSLLAGVAFQQVMTLSSSDGRRQYNQDLKAPSVPMVGVQFVLRNPRLSRHLGLSLGGYFQRRNYQGTAPGEIRNSFTVEDHIDIAYNADFLRIPLGLTYEFGQGALRPFLEASVVAEVRLNERDNAYTTYYKPYNGLTRQPDMKPLFEGARGVIPGFQVSAGLNLHRPAGHDSALRVQYELHNGVSPIVSVGSVSSMLTALLSYNLTKN